MDIATFETFLETHRQAFETFLKGCTELNREHMRIALGTHSSRMTFALTTQYPILGIGPGVAHCDSPSTPRSARRSITSPFKSPATMTSLRSSSPPGSNRAFKSPGAIPEIPRMGSFFKRNASAAAATPTNTPNSKKTSDPESSKYPAHGSIRTPSGGIRGGIIRGGMSIGGAGRIFKPLPVTPKGKGYGKDDSSSDGSPAPSDDSYTIKRSYPKRTASAKSTKKDKTTSPFEAAARKAENRPSYFDSESTSDFEIPVKPKFAIRKVSSAKSKKDKITPRKGSGLVDVDDDADYSEEQEQTPSKKQKAAGRTGGTSQGGPIEID